jgi:short-subunit dehydrogenase
MNSIQPQIKELVVITGASSGIGASIAPIIAAEGYPVALVARRKERLDRLACEIEREGGCAFSMAVDLASPAALAALPDRIREIGGSPGILINNAGFAWYGFGHEMSLEIAENMIAVNISAATHLTLAFLPEMTANNKGHVINIGSIAGSIPSQGVALYSATKSFLDAFTTSLYRELRGTSVHLSVVRAGAVSTPFFKKAANRPGSQMIPFQRFAIQPKEIAQRVVSLIRYPRRVLYVPRWLRIVPWLELSFGWLMDQVGPALLRSKPRHSTLS